MSRKLTAVGEASLTVVNNPDAVPTSLGRTEFMTAFWLAGSAMLVPHPATSRAGTAAA